MAYFFEATLFKPPGSEATVRVASPGDKDINVCRPHCILPVDSAVLFHVLCLAVTQLLRVALLTRQLGVRACLSTSEQQMTVGVILVVMPLVCF